MINTCKRSGGISVYSVRSFIVIQTLFVILTGLFGQAFSAEPVANAGDDISTTKDQPLGSSIQLNGSLSFDPDSDQLNYMWFGPFPTIEASDPFVYVPEGVYSATLLTSDGTTYSEIDTTVITISPCFQIATRCKNGIVQIVWTNIEGTERYDVYRADENNPSSFDKITETTSTYSTFLDTKITNETTYLYVVGALFEGTWCYSNIASSHPTVVRTRSLVNYLPLIYSLPIEHGMAGITYNYDVNATDPNNNPLSYTLVTYPAGMDIDVSTGLISWLPSEAGSYDIEVQVSDGEGETDTQSFTVVVGELPPLNQPPVADAGGPYSGIVDQEISFDGSESYDLDGDDLVFEWEFGDGTTGAGATPVHSYIEADTYPVTLTVSDNKGGTATDSVMVDVIEGQGTSFAYAYIANSGASDVSVIDLETNTVVQRIEVGQRPYGVEVSPDSERVYVTCEQGGIFVIDTSTNTVIDNITVTASCIAVSPDCATVYAVCPFENAVSVIDASSNTVTNIISVGVFPHGIAISPDGLQIYVTNMLNESVSVIDTSTNEVIEEIWLSEAEQPKDVEITPDGFFVYVTTQWRIWVLESSTNTVVEYLELYSVGNDLNPEYLSITPDGLYLFVTCEDGSLSIIDTATNQMTGEMIFYEGLSDISFTNNGAYLYIPDAASDCVHIIDATDSGNTISPVIEDLSQPYTCGHFIAVTKYRIIGKVVSSPDGPGIENVRLTLKGDGLIKTAVTDADGYYIFFVPDGSYTFSASKQGYIFSPESIFVTMNNEEQTVADIVIPVAVDLAVDNNSVPRGESVTLIWDTVNASEVYFDNDIGTVGLSGSITLSPEETTVYTITAENAEGESVSSSISITVYQPPTVSFSVDPAEMTAGESSVLSWSTTNAYQASIDNGIGVVEINGIATVTPTQTTDYTITATGLGGTVTQAVTLTVYQPPVVSITTDRSEIIAGESSIISWTSDNADIITIEPGIGNVEPNGYITVEPLETTTYTITASGSGGSTSGNVTITVYQVPTVTISADPSEIIYGQATTLTWNSTDAATASIDNGIVEVETSGTLVVTPTQTTTYTITVNGLGGSAHDSITIAVIYSTVEGTVTDAMTGLPLSGVSVSVEDSIHITGGTTEDNGYFAISDIIPGDYTAIFEKQGYITQTINGNISPGQTSNLYVQLSQIPGLDITIVSPHDGDIVAASLVEVTGIVNNNAQVTVNGMSATVTEETFMAVISLVEGANEITVHAEDSYAQSSTITITVTLNSNTIILNGTVLDGETDDPIDGVVISVIDTEKTQTAICNSSGEFCLTNVTAGEITVSGSKEGYYPLERNYTVSPGVVVNLTLIMEQIPVHATLTGYVTDGTTGEPLSDVLITISNQENTLTVDTVSDGSYTISNITPGTFEIAVGKQGYLSINEYANITNPYIYTADFVLYSESARVTVNGTVTNAKTCIGEPGVEITLLGEDQSVQTDDTGSFILEDVQCGMQSFKIFKEGFVSTTCSVEINRDPYPLDVVYPQVSVEPYPAHIDQNIVGNVYDALSCQPLQNAIVKITGYDTEVLTNSEGQFALNDLPPGEVIITVLAYDHESVIMCPTVIPGESSTLNFHLPPTTEGIVAGMIRDADAGDPVSSAQVRIKDSALLATDTQYDGSYALVDIPEGTYAIEVLHPEYQSIMVEDVVVDGIDPTTLDIDLTRRPEVGTLEGVISDKDTGDPVSEVSVAVEGMSTVTDIDGYYCIEGVPSGMVTITLQASGYPLTSRKTAVMADIDEYTPSVTTSDFQLDSTDPAGVDTISELIIAADGGSITTPDNQFSIVIPPGALSDDAIVTLMPAEYGPSLSPGDDLDIDPELGMSDIKALGDMIQLVVEPAQSGDEIPTLTSWVMIAGRYCQSQVQAYNIDEESIFPYYWDGTNWTVLRMKPYEMLVDPINNLSLSVVSFSETESGDQVVAQLGTRKPIMLAQLDDHIPDVDWAKIYKLILGGVVKTVWITPNVKIYENKDGDEGLSVVPDDNGDILCPNPNALPLFIIHGWDSVSILMNYGGADPNDINGRYYSMLQDIVEATNGVYRPVFISYNSRKGIENVGNKISQRLHHSGEDLFGGMQIAGEPDSGVFPYFDTFGFSMGGLISRTYQASSGKADNMVIIGAPNHGAFGFIHYIMFLGIIPEPVTQIISSIGGLTVFLELYSPGTADLLGYDDRLPALISGNSSLHALNTNPKSTALSDLTLIAGTDGLVYTDFLIPGKNDGIVSVDSVLCKTTNPDDGDASLLNTPGQKNEYLEAFNHFNIGFLDGHPIQEFIDKISCGLTDWTVSRITDFVFDEPESDEQGYASVDVDVQYNVPHNNIVGFVLVIYSQDIEGNWHIYSSGYNGADTDWHIEEGSDAYFDDFKGVYNSKYRDDTLSLSASCYFPASAPTDPDHIESVEFVVIPLNPDQDEIPHEPKGGFGMPR